MAYLGIGRVSTEKRASIDPAASSRDKYVPGLYYRHVEGVIDGPRAGPRSIIELNGRHSDQ
jgi:hypothetical protein